MIALTVVSETAKTLTVGWTPVSGASGYEFLVDGKRVSNTWDATTKQVKFGKPDAGEHTYSVLVLGKTDEGDLVWPAVTPPPGSSVGVWDIQACAVHPQNATLKPRLVNNAGWPYLIAGVAVAPYTASTPLVNVTTSEQQASLAVPIPAGVLYGPSNDRLLQLYGPNGWYSLSDISTALGAAVTHAFGATHIPAGAPQWLEPAPNSTSAARIPFGWFNAEDVVNKNYKTLAFSVSNPGLDKAVYPADITVSTKFNGTGACTGLGTTARLPKGYTFPVYLDQVEAYILNCALLHGLVERDEGFSWGFYLQSYANQGGDSYWDQFGAGYLNMLNGTRPYARKTSSAFKSALASVEIVDPATLKP